MKWTTKQVVNWFGERGVALTARNLKEFHWQDGKLYFVVEGSASLADTDEGMVDVAETHTEDGKPILVYELYDSIPLEDSPLAPPPADG